MVECLFCNQEEPKHKPDKNAQEIICSNCFQLLLNADKEDLKRSHELATEKGYRNKAKAIESFIELEMPNGRPGNKLKRDTDRKRINRTVGR